MGDMFNTYFTRRMCVCVCPWHLKINGYLSILLQIWAEQEALASAALTHLGKQNMRVTVAVITRQKDLRDR